MIPYDWIQENEYKDIVRLLCVDGILQSRNFDGFAYELTVNERKILVLKYHLKEKWMNSNNSIAFAYSIQAELDRVA